LLFSGEEKAEMVSPFKKNIRLLGLGTTIGTPEEGISHDVIVVRSFDELDAAAARNEVGCNCCKCKISSHLIVSYCSQYFMI